MIERIDAGIIAAMRSDGWNIAVDGAAHENAGDILDGFRWVDRKARIGEAAIDAQRRHEITDIDGLGPGAEREADCLAAEVKAALPGHGCGRGIDKDTVVARDAVLDHETHREAVERVRTAGRKKIHQPGG